ncbi:MAG: FliM/FliN family flagellar motor switch protein [Solirubrobacteraceae bacterium]|nr:FliM/FliN family flagellar motor switch protein [Solirubrobacteraceae bacterium]
MKTAFDPIAAAATEAARATLPEQVQVGAITPLPRGADPFVGAERPLLMAATRWTLVAPGGVLLGGAPAAMAAILGFDVPARPTPVAPEDRKPDDPPPPKWTDLVADAARESATTVTQAIASAIAPVADLPPDCSATQVSMSDDEAAIRAEVGPIPDAVIVTLHADEHEVRLVVVVPGIMVARLGVSQEPAAPAPAAGADEPAAAPSTALRAELDRALSAVPLKLEIGMGHANIPLARVLHLQDGEVLELEEAVDAPVDLVSDGTRVAFGDLEVSDHGTLVLHVTGIPGRPAAVSPPSLVAEPADLEPAATSGASSSGTSDDASPGDADDAPARVDAPADGPEPADAE